MGKRDKRDKRDKKTKKPSRSNAKGRRIGAKKYQDKDLLEVVQDVSISKEMLGSLE